MFYLKKLINNTARSIKLLQCANIMSKCLDIFVFCYIINSPSKKMITQFEKKSLFNSSLKLFARRVLAANATPLVL